MRSFKKILWAALEKKVYLLTYRHTDSGEIIGTVFVYRWESNNLATKTFLELLEFQESWDVIGQDYMPGHNQTQTLNQFVGY